MFRFNAAKRVFPLTLNSDEKEYLNSLIDSFHEKTGLEFLNIKSLFVTLLEFANSIENIREQKETSILLDENKVISDQEKSELQELLNHYSESKGLKGQSVFTILKDSLGNQPEIQIVEKEVIIEKVKTLESNQILVTLQNDPDKKMILLDEIRKRRAKRYRVEESLEEMVEKMIFNDNIIFNLGGEFYTGY